MQDVELVLRFMAFNEVTHLKYNQKMRAFLNAHMRDRQHINSAMQQSFEHDFLKAVALSYSVFGEKAFRRYSEGNSKNPKGNWEKAVNKAVFDVLMFWFARYEKRQIIECKDAIKERFIKLCVEDREFSDAITLGTADPARVKTRFKKWGDALEDVIATPKNEKRNFTFEQKWQLFEADKSCAVCSQQIETIDDAEVDHRTPFANGGPTELSNAQLTHRFCNRSKGKK